MVHDDETIEAMTKFLDSKGWLNEGGKAQTSYDGWYVEQVDFKPKLKYNTGGYGCDGYGCRDVVWVDDALIKEFWETQGEK